MASTSSSSNAKKKQSPVVSDRTSFLCGLTAGVMQAGIFNPFDRALYLSVKNHVPLLTKQNFVNPYQGFAQAVAGRALSGGLYYPLEHFFMTQIPQDAGPWANFLAGTGAGLTNALILNPITAVRYKTWSREMGKSTSMFNNAKTMYLKGGIRPFTNGLGPTLCRDVVFGGCYTYLRLEFQYNGLPSEYQWCGNMLAAALATVLSGPLNLARNIQYATKSRKMAPSIVTVFVTLMQEIKEKPTAFKQWRHVQNRLRIGWGTGRVAVGMAFGQFVYEELMWRMAIKGDGIEAATARSMVENPLPSFPTRRLPLVQYRQSKIKEFKEAMELENE